MNKINLLAGALACSLATSSNASDYVAVGSIGLTTDYVHRGLSQSSENPALQLSAGVRHRRGYYAHVWASTLDTHRLAPDFGNRSGHEINLLVGAARPINDQLVWEVSFGRYITASTNQILEYDYNEFSASLSYLNRLRATVAYAPRATDHTLDNSKKDGPRTVVELAGEWPLNANVSLQGGLGYSDLSEVSVVRHTYWSVGLNYRVGRYVASLSVFGTDNDARERFPDGRADNRIALTLLATFGGRR